MADVVGVQILQRLGHSHGALIVLVEHNETILAIETRKHDIRPVAEVRIDSIHNLFPSFDHCRRSNRRFDIDLPQIRVRHFLRQPVERLCHTVLLAARDDPFPLQYQVGKNVFNGPR